MDDNSYWKQGAGSWLYVIKPRSFRYSLSIPDYTSPVTMRITEYSKDGSAHFALKFFPEIHVLHLTPITGFSPEDLTQDAVGAISGISKTIQEINEITTSIAAATLPAQAPTTTFY